MDTHTLNEYWTPTHLCRFRGRVEGVNSGLPAIKESGAQKQDTHTFSVYSAPHLCGCPTLVHWSNSGSILNEYWTPTHLSRFSGRVEGVNSGLPAIKESGAQKQDTHTFSVYSAPHLCGCPTLVHWSNIGSILWVSNNYCKCVGVQNWFCGCPTISIQQSAQLSFPWCNAGPSLARLESVPR